ncbi:uncharacterized protein CPUR_08853 [Claviceps purpurea 20.1]|uniref:Reverse transcriptase n=1 Tax=Claviceps purpurea (strain 20.1) TaxID=1111077 RepID=M1WIR0_CLAP2|nr:uncharacterized protein CPUR_08853 [Claviceps purpurea 20.1]
MCYARKDLDGRPLPPPPTKKTPDTVAALKRALEEDSTEEVEPELEQQPPQKGHHEPSGGLKRPNQDATDISAATSSLRPAKRQAIEEPITGGRPIVNMTLLVQGQEFLMRTLLDGGSTLPVFSLSTARKLNIPLRKRAWKKTLYGFNDVADETGGRYVTQPLILRHQQDHYTQLAFEISNLSDVDIILPHWWMQQHQPVNLFDKDANLIAFSSDYCRKHCCTPANLQPPPDTRGAATKATWIATASLATVPEDFRHYIPIMTEEAALRLPDHQPWDHKIELIDGKQPPWGPLYAMSARELATLKPWLEKMLKTGRIRRSTAPCGAPLMFADKKDPNDPLRPVVDYRGLNKITVPVRYPIPLIQELQDHLQGALYFTKIDLKTGFNLIRMAEGHEWKTAFRCRYGLYEFLVMPFGLMNAPATFQALMNYIFRDLLDAGLLVYMDDLLIYAKTVEEHDALVKEVLSRLSQYNLAVAAHKCHWRVTKVEFLGYDISTTGISMTSDKTRCIQNWQAPTSLKGVQKFLGFSNFYRRFIRDFSKIARPLTDSVKLDRKAWQWTQDMQTAFQSLKDCFSTAPILIHFNPSVPVVVEADASDFALGGVLSQQSSDQKLHPVAFHSRKLTPAEINYEIHDKELLAIVDCFKRWRPCLEGAQHRIEVFSDHHNLEYFTRVKVLNRRQARWAQELSSYNFIIIYRPAKKNEKADILSRLPQHKPDKLDDQDQPVATVLKPTHFAPSVLISSARLCSLSTRRWNPAFITKVKTAGALDEAYKSELDKEHQEKHFTIEEGLLYWKNRLWVPTSLQAEVLASEHDTRVAGHMGIDKTTELISRNFWWPDLQNSVRRYVSTCLECQRNKTPKHLLHGLLQPMELHYKPWQSVAMDFITDLPLSNGCDSIWVMVDPFTKMAHFIPLKVNGKRTEDLIHIFARHYWKHHGIPLDIISDRDSRFTSHLWKDFLKLLGIKSRMSTAFHPQTDGQTERTNQTLEIYLRAFVNYEMSNWEDLLPTAEFAYNNTTSASSGLTPFYANYGYHPAAHNPPSETPLNPGSRLYAHWMTQVHEHAKKHLERSQKQMKHWADKRRSEAPIYKDDQLVMLNAKNIRTKRPAQKLDKKMLGPFKILKVISPTAVQLSLPKKWRIHNTFHVSLIEPFRSDEQQHIDPNRVLREAVPIEPENYEVRDIRDSQTLGTNVKYLVRWAGWPAKKDWTWEPYEHFMGDGAKALLKQYATDHPDKPQDPRVHDVTMDL